MLGPYGQIIKHALPVVQKVGASFQAMRQQAARQLHLHHNYPRHNFPRQNAARSTTANGRCPVGYPQPGAIPQCVPPAISRCTTIPVSNFPVDGDSHNNRTRGHSRAGFTCAVQWRGPSGLVPINAAPAPRLSHGSAANVPVAAPVGRRRYRAEVVAVTSAPDRTRGKYSVAYILSIRSNEPAERSHSGTRVPTRLGSSLNALLLRAPRTLRRIVAG